MSGEIIRGEFDEPVSSGRHKDFSPVELTPEEIEAGLDEQLPEIETLLIKTDAFEAEALPIYDMPMNSVLDMMSAEGGMQVLMTMELFKLALMDPRKVEMFEVLSFRQFTQVLDQWSAKSSDAANRLTKRDAEERRERVRDAAAEALGLTDPAPETGADGKAEREKRARERRRIQWSSDLDTDSDRGTGDSE